jgi:hypothetical protein
MKAPTAHGVGPKKADILTDVITQVLAMGATRFEVNQDYGQGEVWAVKGPLELSIASFPSDSAKAIELTRTLHELKANPANMMVNGSEYRLGIEIVNLSDHEEFEVTVTPFKPEGNPT